MIPPSDLQFTRCLKTVQFNNYLQAAHYINTTPKLTQAVPKHADPQPIKHTTMKHTREDSPPPYTTNLLKLLFLTTHYKSDDYTDQFPLYTVPHYITRKKHPGHDNYLYQRWNNLTARSKTKKTHKTNQRLVVKRSTTKDDTSVTSTLKTLCTQDTRFSHSNNVANDTILSITIWNQPISQYRIPPQPNTGHQSRGHPSTAVR